MTKTRNIIVVFSLLFVLLVSSSFPQSPGTSPARMGMRPWRGDTRCWKASDLNLSSDQTKGLDLINQTYLRETRLLRTELFSKRMELREFLTNPNIKPESIQQKTAEIIELQSKIEEREIGYLIKVRALLTNDQIKNWCPEQEFVFMRGMVQRPEFTGPMNPRKIPAQERPKEE